MAAQTALTGPERVPQPEVPRLEGLQTPSKCSFQGHLGHLESTPTAQVGDLCTTRNLHVMAAASLTAGSRWGQAPTWYDKSIVCGNGIKKGRPGLLRGSTARCSCQCDTAAQITSKVCMDVLVWLQELAGCWAAGHLAEVLPRFQ